MKTNYCGFGKSLFLKPPRWALFNASCRVHDDNYSEGGSKELRLKADLGFLWRMLEDCNQLEKYNEKRLAVLNAITYYILVRIFGWLSWYRVLQRIKNILLLK